MPSLPPPPAHVAHVKPQTAILREINRVRRAHHLEPVKLTKPLTRIARAHSHAMLAHDVLSHSSFGGATFTARMRHAGRHRKYGETLAWAPKGSGVSGKRVVTLWMQSAPHRAVLLDGALRRVGIGRVQGAMGDQAGHAITADFTS